MPRQRDHHALFVQTDPTNELGYLYHVVSTVNDDMEFESFKTTRKIDESDSFLQKNKIGKVSTGDLQSLKATLISVAPSEKQFNGAFRIHPSKPLRRCQDWTSEAIEKLQKKGILRE